MSPRRIISFSGRAARYALYALLAGIILFFALTRTEVGREGLRMEIERQFAERFDGQIEIGRLSGNLMQGLSAGDVAVHDSAGRLVIAVDSIIAHPSWRDLLQRTIATGSVTLVRPEVHLTRDSDGSWNLASVFAGGDSLTERAPWSFHSTDITIVDGRVMTHTIGPEPRLVRSGAIFDYADAEAVDLNGRAIIEWSPRIKLIDILQMSGRVPDVGVPIDSLRGQLVIQGETLGLNEVHVRLGGTRLHLAGSFSSSPKLEAPLVEVDLRSSTLRADEITRIFPSLPVADEVAASLRAQGPLSELVVEELNVTRGRSRISAEGTLLGLPDSLDYELAFRPSSVTWRDVVAVVPGAARHDLSHLETIQFSGYSDAVVRFGDRAALPFFEGKSELQTTSRAGRIHADVNLAFGGAPAVVIDGSVLTHAFDLGGLLRRPDLTSALNGSGSIRASGASLADVTGDALVSLSRSHLAGRRIDTLNVQVAGEEGRVSGRISARQGAASIFATGRGTIDSLQSTYEVAGDLRRIDLGSVLLSDSVRSSLNLRFRLDGRGNSLDAFHGDLDLAFRESMMAYGGRERTVASHRTAVTLRQVGAASPVLQIDGDALALRVTGDVEVEPLRSMAAHWTAAFRESVENARGMPLHPDTTSVAAVALPSGAATASGPSPALDPAEPEVESPTRTLRASVDVKRADILSALLPMLPQLHTDLHAAAALTFDRRRFAIEASLTADSLEGAGIRSRELAATFDAAGTLEELMANEIDVRLNAAAGRVYFGGQEFVSPTVEAALEDRGLDLTAVTTASGAGAPLQFEGRLDLLSGRSRLRIETLQLAARDQVWRADSTHTIDIYRDALVVKGLTIRRTDEQSAGSERLSVEGTLSPSASDSLSIDLRDLPLQDLMELLVVDRPLGGAMNGELVYTGFRRQPQLTGSVTVETLTYDDRVLGALQIDSRYLPGTPDVGLDLRILPIEPSASDPRRHAVNDLIVSGTFRLPGTGGPGTRDAGALDLDIISRRLDAFFLDYIFLNTVSNASGAFVGSGSIEGTFAHPLFYAALDIEDAALSIPEFNLDYRGTGSVRVDEAGIHLDDVRLTDPREGSAMVNGSILFNDYRYFAFNLRGKLDEMRIMNVSQSRDLPFYGRIAASGDVSLTGPLSNAMLRSTDAVTSEESDLYIPISESSEAIDAGFIVFADSSGRVPDLRRLTTRANLLAERPAGERPFLDGLEMDLNITAPTGSTVHLVIDPLLGDVINAVGGGRIQLVRAEGEFSTYGRFEVDSGDYLFTAGEVFFRRFLIEDGSISWDGDPLNANLDIAAAYRTRASTEGLTDACGTTLIPLVIHMDVVGRVSAPSVELALAIDRDSRSLMAGCAQGLEAELNEPDLTAQYATSVLLTNSFLLTTSSITSEQSDGLSDTRNQLAFNSLSQLVASQLNRYLNYALPNLDVNLGLLGESAQDLDVTYGVALRLLDERLIIRGQGIYQNESTESRRESGLDEFVVEVRLNSSVSVEVFYRREGLLQTTETLSTNTTGAGVSYQTQFATWRQFVERLFGWILPDEKEEAPPPDDVVAGAGNES